MSEKLMGWEAFEKALVWGRYSIRDPKTQERLEKSFDDVAARIGDYFLSFKEKYPIGKNVLGSAVKAFMQRDMMLATPALMNVGNHLTTRKGYYSCFPLGPIPDTTSEILKYHASCTSIFQFAGGAGLDFSKLRGRGAPVDNSQGVSSGPNGFIPMFESVASCISQGGKRRGAMMTQLDSTHPDIVEYVNLKRERRDLESINISVNVEPSFWDNKSLIHEIAQSIWTSGDPGLLFPHEMGENSPYPVKIKKLVRYVNPCAEYCSPPFSACNLITVNALAATSASDFEELGYFAAHLGNMILWITMQKDGEGLPLTAPHFRNFYDTVSELRPIGVGLSGLAEYLISKNLPYNSPEEIFSIYSALARGTLRASSEWGKATKTIAEWDPKYKDNHLSTIKWDGKNSDFWNTTTLCQAPAGSVSQFMRLISTGIEPLESLEIERKFRAPDNTFKTVVLTSRIQEEIERKFKDPNNAFKTIVLNSKENTVLAKPSIKEQLGILSVIQSILHTSASKTINISKETTVEEIESLIYEAKKRKLKGLTVFREGCILESIVQVSRKESEELDDVRLGKTFRWKAPMGRPNLYVIVNHDQVTSEPKEVFVSIGQSGSEVNALCAGLGRLVSIALQAGALTPIITKALGGIESGNYFMNTKAGRASSICDALAKTLLEFSQKDSLEVAPSFDLCPQCHQLTLSRVGNCKNCSKCDYNTC